MKIGVYVLEQNAKITYKKECYNVRINAGMSIVVDCLKKAGYEDITYCGKETAHRCDAVLYSCTADCDWWEFIAERVTWAKSKTKVVVGGAGCLNVRPFLELVDYFSLGRCEGVIEYVIQCIENDMTPNYEENNHVIYSKTFDKEKSYYLKQVDESYKHELIVGENIAYEEGMIGCNHHCFFCGYTWHRKCLKNEAFHYHKIGGKSDNTDFERAIIDINNGVEIDLVKLRTTAIDGFSERLRKSVNKPITRDMFKTFLEQMLKCEKPHKVKIFNLVGLPTETEKDWFEYLEDVEEVDKQFKKQDKQTCLMLHSTPFRPMPATPMACDPMSYKNYRNEIPRVLGAGKYKGGIIYKGNAVWSVDSGFVESLPTVIQSAIVWRGTENDTSSFVKIATSKKYKNLNTIQKTKTLEKYFDTKKLFDSYEFDDLATKYLKSHSDIDSMLVRRGKKWEESNNGEKT